MFLFLNNKQRTLAQVTPERLLNTEAEPENWLLHGGDCDSHRHSDLTQITR